MAPRARVDSARVFEHSAAQALRCTLQHRARHRYPLTSDDHYDWLKIAIIIKLVRGTN